MLKRILLFIVTNALVMLTISIIIHLLGVNIYLSQHGINYQSLLIFCFVWGMGGACISLLTSRMMAKFAMGVTVINPQQATAIERTLLDLTYQLAHQAGLTVMPEVGIYDSPELNAFATGPSRNHSLVAVSSGLLNNMNRAQVSAILGHEISHIANGDMVTMTLLQGIINAFALFLSRIISYAITMATSNDDEKGNAFSSGTYLVLTLFFDVVFTLLGSILVLAFSRWREYRADYGGAKLCGRDQMISALAHLERNNIQDERAPSLATFKIKHHSWLALLATHPTIESRINRLKTMK